ncbi:MULTISPECIES: RNA 2',3'-cyclic phosphodiesterase [unclassified Nocardioides]|uniref:RNA 2',3'-cyclic phosphodiesterase n=1 Tax=unclassified Nocardioides TaxID=2615069 RepID=UPI001151B078|nr:MULTISPECIES: RNA 2',3'-cyclic phosphodiesterase [unclassified Nocardioides]TQK73305.1 2'-5' RNA ligase [Nocardioides sp. SLBN-35]WGY02458.1 RNA 2',3'-cyclic phosphodiesterase [Nocardioides sp. QY071]
MRLFTAVVPPPEAVEHLDAFLDPRRAAASFRWTRPEQLHVTLAFMAEAEERRVDAYVDRLAESLDGLSPVELTLAGAVVFPNVAEGRVLATGVTGGDETLATASVRARNAAVACGIEVDGQRFRPHLTVARTGGHPTEMTSWVRLLDTYEGPAWPCASVHVIASHLGEGPRRSPRYEPLAEIVL